MTKTSFTYCEYHLGDQINAIHALRRFAKEHSRSFVHFCPTGYIEQLSPMVQDIHNLKLAEIESHDFLMAKPKAINLWKDFRNFWNQHHLRWDWSAFTIDHNNHIAKQMGLNTRFSDPSELLLDYPALNPNNVGGSYFYDVLFINSEPGSAQFKPMAEHGSGYFDEIIQRIAKKFSIITTVPVFGVECTKDSRKSITDIGRLSLTCKHIISVATGPFWATMNTTNNHHRTGRKRVVLLDNGEIIGMPAIEQCATREELIPHLREFGLL